MNQRLSRRATYRVITALAACGLTLGISPAVAQDLNSFDSKSVEDLKPEEPVAADQQVAERFIVTFNDMTGLNQDRRMKVIDEIVSEHSSDASFVREMFDGSYVVELDPPVPADRVMSLRGHLESKAEIAYADIDFKQYNLAIPNDQHYKHQWHLWAQNGVKAEAAWDTGATGRGVTIAVVDSGITYHPDLQAKILPGADLISDPGVARDGDGRDMDPSDQGDWTNPRACGPKHRGGNSSWHGTHVAGIAAASTNNGEGVAGVAPDSNIVPVRVLGACGGYLSDIADGIAWAAGLDVPGVTRNANPAQVINLSLGGKARKCSLPYQRAISAANRTGATIAVAAGNDDIWTDNVQPANCADVITVGATGPEGYRSVYSNFGQAVDIAAPGGNMDGYNGPNVAGGILSTVNKGTHGPSSPAYSFMEGTSMATPVVSGVIALMKSANPSLSNAQIEQILKQTAQPFQRSPFFAWKTEQLLGAGIVDAQAAVCKATGQAADCGKDNSKPQPEPTPTPNLSPTPKPIESNASESDSIPEARPSLEPEPEPEKKGSSKFPLLRLLDWWRD